MTVFEGTDGPDDIVGTAGNDKFDGKGGDDRFVGLEGRDTIFGGAGGDLLFGGQGNDLVYGGEDNEFGLEGGPGDDTIDGGDGVDRVRFREAETGIWVDLAEGTARDGQGGIDRLISIERVEDTAFDDVIRGDDLRNAFRMSFGGNDTIDGRGDQDTVDYGNAADAIVADLSSGTVRAADGSVDRVVSIESVFGTAFADTIIGSQGNYFEAFAGLAGDDYIDGGAAIDETRREGGATSHYFDSPSGIVADLRSGIVHDGYGTIDRIKNINEISGSAYADVIRGGAHDFFENFIGGAGDDLINGRSGYDQVSYSPEGGPGGIVVDLRSGIAIDSFGSSDRLRQIEAIVGTAFDDSAHGSGAPFESFRMLGGDDYVDGRGGIDRIDYIRDVAGVSVDLDAGTAADGFGGHDRLVGIENARGSTFDDRLYGDGRDNELTGDVGSDRLLGRAGDDRLFGGAGYDVLNGGFGNDELWGGAGRDRFVFRSIADGQDLIQDFDALDVLDFRGITAAHHDSSDNAGDFVRVSSDTDGVLIAVDADGVGSLYDFEVIVRIVNGQDISIGELVSEGRLLLG